MACFNRFCVIAAVLALLGGCVTEKRGAATSAVTSASTATGSHARLLRWGTGSGQVQGTLRGNERMAEGPSAVAVGPDGAVFVLDRLNGRVLRVSDGVTAVADVPVDSEELAVAADGGGKVLIAAWSLLRGRVVLRVAGEDVGEVSVPRALRLARGISLDASRQVLVHNAHQETYRLGSPATGRALAAVLRSKREGAYFLADGSGVQVRRRPDDGRAEVLVLGTGERATVKHRWLLDDVVAGVRVVGVADGRICLRMEKSAPGRGVAVKREAVCVRASDGVEVLRRSLAAPGRYLPRRELALGGSPARLAWIHPTADGLEVQVWRLPGDDAAATEVSP